MKRVFFGLSKLSNGASVLKNTEGSFMKNIIFLCWMVLICIISSCNTTAPSCNVTAPPTNPGKPNIIFLFADDQRADTIAAHGNPYIKTPHLDKLSEEGFSFKNNYCAGSYSGAVCIASRSMLMTGQQWMRIPGKSRSNWKGFNFG